MLFRREALIPALPWSDARPLLLDLDLYTKVLTTWDLITQRVSIGSFRVSATSWSTRMARTQSRQLRAWQGEYAQICDPNPVQRVQATLAVSVQTGLRRTAYLWLSRRSRLVAARR